MYACTRPLFTNAVFCTCFVFMPHHSCVRALFVNGGASSQQTKKCQCKDGAVSLWFQSIRRSSGMSTQPIPLEVTARERVNCVSGITSSHFYFVPQGGTIGPNVTPTRQQTIGVALNTNTMHVDVNSKNTSELNGRDGLGSGRNLE